MSPGAASSPATSFEHGRMVADAVLYEGYVLYPYRATAPKNRLRWQFGVLVPPAFGAEPSWQRTECLVEGLSGDLHVVLRFLQLQQRTVERAGPSGEWEVATVLGGASGDIVPFEEGVEHRVEAVLAFDHLHRRTAVVPIDLPGGSETELVDVAGGRGRVRRQRWPLAGRIVVSAEPVAAPVPAARLRVVVENTSPEGDRASTRSDALRHSLLGVHVLLGLTEAAFVSLLEPPDWAERAAERCSNRHTYPVLLGRPGDRDAVLSSPVILYDHPQVAPESPGDFFDATEIDELLTLRTLTLTDAEKREARATDPRAAAILDRVESLTPETMGNLHGTVRINRTIPATEPPEAPDEHRGLPPGTRVRLRPARSADAQDMFLAGKEGVVERTVVDVDGTVFVTVTVAEDPATELHEWYGRFLYFRPEELELLGETG